VTVPRSKSIGTFRKAAARRMRVTATTAEMRLWRHLRRHPMLGSHFRRQVVIGPYIADFACMAAKLVIEVDGSQHGEDTQRLRDSVRTAWLEAEGFRVLRYWNNDVLKNIDGVLDEIHVALHPSMDELPQLKHNRRRKVVHPTPASSARRPSPSRGG
jgi:very-short-patch-repair endonuclease